MPCRIKQRNIQTVISLRSASQEKAWYHDEVAPCDGALTRTYVGNLADIAGSNPATGTARYYIHDHLGSTRGVYDASKNSLGTFEFTPYGSPYHSNGPADITHLFTGHDLDPLTGNYYAPFRYLNPSAGRWMNQDPLGMINGTNMYGYVGASPIIRYDLLGTDFLTWVFGLGWNPTEDGRQAFYFSLSIEGFGVTARFNWGPVTLSKAWMGNPEDDVRKIGTQIPWGFVPTASVNFTFPLPW